MYFVEHSGVTQSMRRGGVLELLLTALGAQRTTRQLACGASADGSVETGLAYCPTAH